MRWELFLRRLERTTSSEALPHLLRLVKDAQLFVAAEDRHLPESTAGSSSELVLRVSNLGQQSARLAVEVVSRDGQRVGPSPKVANKVEPGGPVPCRVKLEPAQWQVLREGGHFLLSPGRLPEEDRSVYLVTDPFTHPAQLEWPLQLPYVARFSLPGKVDLGRDEVEIRVAEGKVLTAGFPPAADESRLALVLPLAEVHYRLRRDGKTSLDPHQTESRHLEDGEWSLLAPKESSQRWLLENPTPFPITGGLRAFPPGILEVEPAWLDLPPKGRTSLELKLTPQAPEVVAKERPEVAIRLVPLVTSANPKAAAESKTLLRVSFVTYRYQGPVLSRREPWSNPLRIRSRKGRLGVEIGLENSGGEATDVVLDLGTLGRSEPATVAPRLGDEPSEAVLFYFSPSVVEKLGDEPVRAELVASPQTAWSGDSWWLKLWVTKVEPRPPEECLAEFSKPGDLYWDLSRQESGLAVLSFRSRHPHPVNLTVLNLYRDGYPQPTRHLYQTAMPGEVEHLITEALTRPFWGKNRVRAEVEVERRGSTAVRAAGFEIGRRGDPVPFPPE